ncbi:hypothetical protein ACFO4O_16350 [Glaciecola siphonariae]|uniref:Uncharacterized protein n=1 Tax=Glaciecola siphonariae TaxID=521012 RepID=A0ABV9M0H4_9ALTE
MFAVIFKAQVGNQDSQYSETVAIMRDLAFNKYNCQYNPPLSSVLDATNE